MKKIKELFNAMRGVGSDKLLHFIAGILICTVISGVMNLIWHTSYRGAIIGMFIGIMVGFVKEVYDSFNPDMHPEFKDYLFTVCGSITGFLLVLINTL